MPEILSGTEEHAVPSRVGFSSTLKNDALLSVKL